MKETNEKTLEETLTGAQAESSEVVRINFDHLKKATLVSKTVFEK